MEKVVIDNVELVLSAPVEQRVDWIGQDELIDQLLAAWLVVDERDLPLCPRLIGKPGVGKTTLACAAARAASLPVYIHQCTVDTRPEDLIVTPVLARDGHISYHASPLVSALLTGGAVVLDEANRMSEKSWASLAPLLDHRRYVDSIVAGVRIPAAPGFRACVTMNDDASTFEVPDYMLSRLQPSIQIDYPQRDDELRILGYHLPFAPEEILDLTVEFLQGGHAHGLPYSVRDGINIVRYALKLHEHRRVRPDRAPASAPDEKSPARRPAGWKHLFDRSMAQVLGDDAADFEKQALSSEVPSYLELREFFESFEDRAGDDPDHDLDPDDLPDGEISDGDLSGGDESDDPR